MVPKASPPPRTVLYADEIDISPGEKEMYADEMALSLSNDRSTEKAKVCIPLNPAAKHGTDLSINNGGADNATIKLRQIEIDLEETPWRHEEFQEILSAETRIWTDDDNS